MDIFYTGTCFYNSEARSVVTTVKKDKAETIQEFWNNQALQHQTELAATTPDPLAKDLEIAALVRHLDPGRDTLEFGCGNGGNILRLLDVLKGRITGVDYAEAMIEAARKVVRDHPESKRVSLQVGDILADPEGLGTFSQIFTTRCLINQTSLDLQVQAVENMERILDPGGRLVLIESVSQGQEKINELREMIGLKSIPYHWHNLYIDEPAFLERIPASLHHVETDNFASLYFLISRVFNARLVPEGEEPDYLSEINKIAAQLPSVGELAPLKLYHFEKMQ